jgi:flagellum-specific ATP synthase
MLDPLTTGLMDRLQAVRAFHYRGRVSDVVGILIEAEVPGTGLGSICEIEVGPGKEPVAAEVIGFRGSRSLLMPFGNLSGVAHGSVVRPVSDEYLVTVGDSLLGRVLGPLGHPIDGRGPIRGGRRTSIHREPPDPLQRERIRSPLTLGVRAIDGLLTIGKGQRVGIMAGTGVGKSTLLGMVARNVEADVSVIALVGERGREVREFIEEALGPEGMARSVVVAVTGDASPVLRVRAAFVATTIAEHFRDSGRDVLFMMDSVTRLAMAQREIGLAAGEPPTAKGYTPSVFAMLPKLLERCGTHEGGGSITGIYTVLVEGDDFNDPIADSVRGILDGHIVLTRELAARNHFPAIDILQSTSRVMKDVADPAQIDDAGLIRELLAVHRDAEELVNIGAYQTGSNPTIDRAIEFIGPIRAFLRQKAECFSTAEETLGALAQICADARGSGA